MARHLDHQLLRIIAIADIDDDRGLSYICRISWIHGPALAAAPGKTTDESDTPALALALNSERRDHEAAAGPAPVPAAAPSQRPSFWHTLCARATGRSPSFRMSSLIWRRGDRIDGKDRSKEHG